MDEKEEMLKNAKINRALGLFILFFGIVILISTFFTVRSIGMLTNLIAGLVLSAVGGGMMIQSARTRKKFSS
jgi:hypothetical protein